MGRLFVPGKEKGLSRPWTRNLFSLFRRPDMDAGLIHPGGPHLVGQFGHPGVRDPQPLGQGLGEDPVDLERDLVVPLHQDVKLPFGQDQEGRVALDQGRGRARALVDQGHLAQEIPHADHGQLLLLALGAGFHQAHGSGDHHVQGVSLLALVEQGVVLEEGLLVAGPGQGLQVGVGKLVEQVHAAEIALDLLPVLVRAVLPVVLLEI